MADYITIGECRTNSSFDEDDDEDEDFDESSFECMPYGQLDDAVRATFLKVMAQSQGVNWAWSNFAMRGKGRKTKVDMENKPTMTLEWLNNDMNNQKCYERSLSG